MRPEEKRQKDHPSAMELKAAHPIYTGTRTADERLAPRKAWPRVKVQVELRLTDRLPAAHKLVPRTSSICCKGWSMRTEARSFSDSARLAPNVWAGGTKQGVKRAKFNKQER